MTLTLPLQGHSRSNLLVPLDPHIWFPVDDLLRDIRLWNLNDLKFDLSRSLMVKCDSGIRLPIYGFLLMLNSNTGAD